MKIPELKTRYSALKEMAQAERISESENSLSAEDRESLFRK